MAYLGMPNPALYTSAVRAGTPMWYTVDASYRGQPVAGATGMLPAGGTITDTSKPGVRRVLNLQLPGDTGLYRSLQPIGTLLTATCHVQLTNRTVVTLPMGVFDVDEGSVAEAGAGNLSITAPDKWQKIVRAKFVRPQVSNEGVKITDQIVQLIKGALGDNEPVVVTATSREMMGNATWATDRAQTIIDLATSIGAWVYFDRNGVAMLVDIPQAGYTADWVIDAGVGGVAVSIDWKVSRSSTFNVVAVTSSSSSYDQSFDPQYAFDSNPNSPTYAGPDPVNQPQLAGPFGVSVYNYETSSINNASQAAQTAYAILSTTVGLASQVTVEGVPNPAIDSFDALDIVGLSSTTKSPQRHWADTVTHSLDVTQSQHIDGRSTRTDAYT